MNFVFLILTFFGFKQKYLKFKKPLETYQSLEFRNFLRNNKFDDKSIYSINSEDIVIFSLFNKIFFSFPVKITFVYENYYNPPDIFGNGRIPEYLYYSQRLIAIYINKQPENIKHKNDFKNIVYVN